MNKITLIALLAVAFVACNSNPGSNNTTTDSFSNKEDITPPPGLGSDPTRNDASKIAPEAGDSSIHKSDAGATPGLGSDPTRNDASKPAPDSTPRKN
jgi:hypothetical protein